MNRRSVLKLGAACMAPVLLRNVHARDVVTLRFHTFVPATSNVYANVISPWMKRVETESQGRIRFQSFTSMQMGGAPAQLYDQARDGVVDIIWSLAGYTPGRFPRSEIFELPFFTYDGEGALRAAWTYVERHAQDEFPGVKLIAGHTNGLNALHMRRHVVRTLADLQRAKIRGATRLATQTLAALGAQPIGMPLPATAEALSKGVIDGAVVPWDTVPQARLEEMTPFHTEFPAGMKGFSNNFQFLVMNQARYDSLPDELKAVIDRNSGFEVSATFGRDISAGDGAVRQRAIDRGNTVHVIEANQIDSFVNTTLPVVDNWIKEMNDKGYDGRQLFEAGQALIETYRPRT